MEFGAEWRVGGFAERRCRGAEFGGISGDHRARSAIRAVPPPLLVTLRHCARENAGDVARIDQEWAERGGWGVAAPQHRSGAGLGRHPAEVRAPRAERVQGLANELAARLGSAILRE